MQSFLRSAAVFLALSACCYGQQIIVPKTVPSGALIVARAQSGGESVGFSWFVVANGQMIFDPSIVHTDTRTPDTLIIGGGDGTYSLALITSRIVSGGITQSTTFAVIQRGGVGPGPGPGPGPIPPPVPPPSGKLNVVILHETAEDTSAQANLITSLQAGEVAAYLKSKGHRAPLILDDDSVGPDGQPALKKWEAALAGTPLPAIFLLDAKSNALIHKAPLPATSADVLALIKQHGG